MTGEMNPMLPIIHFLPSMDPQPKKGVYTCPLYKTSVSFAKQTETSIETFNLQLIF